MALSIVQLGSAREKSDLRIGTVRRPPRGVRKEDYGKLNYFDVWLPLLSPTTGLVKLGKKITSDEKLWDYFKKKFKAEMKKPDATQALKLLAALSHQTEISIGCYCENESRCHRSVLKELLTELGAKISNS